MSFGHLNDPRYGRVTHISPPGPQGRHSKDWEIIVDSLERKITAASEQAEKLQKWVNDLQSGGFVNCVYCGHRYGPDDGTTPVAMADVLRKHIEQCPDHPLSQAKADLDNADEAIEKLSGVASLLRIDLEATRRDLADTNERYEELRQIIGRGSKSMTHEDAVQELRTTLGVLVVVNERVRVAEADTTACNDAWYERSLELHKRIDDGIVALYAEKERVEKLSVDLGHEKSGRNILAGQLAAANERASRWELAATNAKREEKMTWQAAENAHRCRNNAESDLADRNTEIKTLKAACDDRDTVIAVRGNQIVRLRGALQGAARAAKDQITDNFREIKRLRDTLKGAAKVVEDLAFKMPPPNRYTPDFVGIAISMRHQVLPPKVARKQDPDEHYDTDPGGDDRGGG